MASADDMILFVDILKASPKILLEPTSELSEVAKFT